MITLYDNPFSPFARKVRMVLDYKDLPFTRIDALALAHLDELLAVNPRGEVPVLVDGDATVVNSADIVAYLEHRYPEPAIYPAEPAARVAARAWERLADGVLDAVLHDVSLWTWPTHHRQDSPPPGLIEAGRGDVAVILTRADAALRDRDFLAGALSIADFAVFPHVTSLRVLGIAMDPARYPRLADWNRRMRALPMVQADLENVRRAVREKFVDRPSPYEAEKVIWRGDRLEWLLRHGFADWWYEELRGGRAVVPAGLLSPTHMCDAGADRDP
jgi:glutathione S-transferase